MTDKRQEQRTKLINQMSMRIEDRFYAGNQDSSSSLVWVLHNQKVIMKALLFLMDQRGKS